MSDPETSPPAAPAAEGSPSPARKEELLPVGEKISELDQSQSELLGRLRGLKEDLQNWRSNLDTQVNKYRTELSDIKSSLNNEIEQLRSDFQELRTTLKKQQEDVTLSLQNLGLDDSSGKQEKNEDAKNEKIESTAEDGAGAKATKEGSGSGAGAEATKEGSGSDE